MKKKHVSAALAVACVATMLTSSLAFFTDRINHTTGATAGVLDLELGPVSTSKSANLKPGEGIDIDFTLSNKGSKSTDVIETLVLSSSVALTDKDGAAELELYSAADVDLANGLATVKDGKQPLAVRTSGGSYTADKDGDGAPETTYYTIKYVLPEFILSGAGAGAEVEYDDEDNAYSTSKVSDYVLVFRDDATNDFQGATLLLDYEAQAKQHRNTDAATWDTIRTQISFAGDATHMAVPDKNS